MVSKLEGGGELALEATETMRLVIYLFAVFRMIAEGKFLLNRGKNFLVHRRKN